MNMYETQCMYSWLWPSLEKQYFFETTILLFYGALALTFFHLLVVLYEEPTLNRKFGDSYESYCARVSRWLPGSPRVPGTKIG